MTALLGLAAQLDDTPHLVNYHNRRQARQGWCLDPGNWGEITRRLPTPPCRCRLPAVPRHGPAGRARGGTRLVRGRARGGHPPLRAGRMMARTRCGRRSSGATAVRLAFQNCHRAAVYRPDATTALAEFTSARSQLLNQSPELRNC
jgi:hypothetical protein